MQKIMLAIGCLFGIFSLLCVLFRIQNGGKLWKILMFISIFFCIMFSTVFFLYKIILE